MNSSGAKYTGTQAVRRAIALLKSFSDGRQEWQVNELAAVNGLNSSTTYRLLSALEEAGLVTRREDNGRYRLGPEMIALGGCALRSHSLRSAARPALQRLAAETGEAATLETLSGGAMIVVDEVSSQHLVGMSQDVGARLPVHATSTGKALLAFASAEEAEAALAGPLEALTERTVTSREGLVRELEIVRGRGYAVAVDELEIGFVAIAAPVFGYDGRVMAAVSVGGPAMRLTPERRESTAAHVMEAARSISSDMGYRA